MPNVKNNAAAQETCRKLLDAAGELFADRGVHATTIKAITDKAQVNVAAVNYHFSDKFELYMAVVRHLVDTEGRDAVPDDLGDGPPAKRLERFVRHFLKHALSAQDKPAWKPMLFARELGQPTAAFEYIAEHIIQPMLAKLEGVVREVLGDDAPHEQVQLHSSSVFGQCLYYLHDRTVVERFQPRLHRMTKRKDGQAIADHIVKCSLAAMGCKRPRTSRSKAAARR
ncbi:CerR family C-terminal domain-containing protein [Planctomycetales bacterium ZRK34]|nr:CerR family C-terminal domain-containing protein [Planctomycetales bacterium ZRK34]